MGCTICLQQVLIGSSIPISPEYTSDRDVWAQIPIKALAERHVLSSQLPIMRALGFVLRLCLKWWPDTACQRMWITIKITSSPASTPQVQDQVKLVPSEHQFTLLLLKLIVWALWPKLVRYPYRRKLGKIGCKSWRFDHLPILRLLNSAPMARKALSRSAPDGEL